MTNMQETSNLDLSTSQKPIQSKRKNAKLPSDELLIRSCDLLNPLGVFRVARLYNCMIDFSDYEKLARRNYGIKEPITPESFQISLKEVWRESSIKFKQLDLLISSTKDRIVIKNPKLGWTS